MGVCAFISLVSFIIIAVCRGCFMWLFLSDIGRKRRRLPSDGFYGAGDGSGAGDGVSRVTSCDDDLKLNRYTLLVDVVTE